MPQPDAAPDALATALMDHETLDETEIYAAARIQGLTNGQPLAARPEEYG